MTKLSMAGIAAILAAGAIGGYVYIQDQDAPVGYESPETMQSTPEVMNTPDRVKPEIEQKDPSMIPDRTGPVMIPETNQSNPMLVPGKVDAPDLDAKDAKKDPKLTDTPYLVPGETPQATPEQMPDAPMLTPNRVPEPTVTENAVPKKDQKGEAMPVPADVKKDKVPNLTPPTIEQVDAKKVPEKGESIIEEDLKKLEADVAKLREDSK